jgi:hypothetical protein
LGALHVDRWMFSSSVVSIAKKDASVHFLWVFGYFLTVFSFLLFFLRFLPEVFR